MTIVTAVGLGAGADSYVHIYGLVRDWHGNIASAVLTPTAADGVVFASTAAIFAASRQGHDVPLRARIWFWVGTLFSVLGNGASGWHYGLGTAAINTVPVLGYIGCMEVLTWLLQHLWGPQNKPAARARVQPATILATNAGTIVPAPPAEPQDIPAAEPQGYRPRRSIEELLEDAREQFAADLTAGKLPASRAIQNAVGCGPGKADQVLTLLAGPQTA